MLLGNYAQESYHLVPADSGLSFCSRLLHRIPISIRYPLFIWLFSFFSFHNKIWNYLERIWTRVKLYFKTNQWPLVLRKQQKSWVIGILRMNQVLMMGAVSWPQLEYCSHCGKISSVATFQIAFETIWWRVLVDHDVWPPIIEIISRHVLVDYVRRGWLLELFLGPKPAFPVATAIMEPEAWVRISYETATNESSLVGFASNRSIGHNAAAAAQHCN